MNHKSQKPKAGHPWRRVVHPVPFRIWERKREREMVIRKAGKQERT